MSGAIHELAELLARLPGVGRRTGVRLAFHLLEASPRYSEQLGEAIARLHRRVVRCSRCGNLDDCDPCGICQDPARDEGTICVVASVPDLWALEESSSFRGRFHVLHGLLSPLDGVGPEDLPLEELKARVEENAVEEVIVATRPSVEGEATAMLIRETLADSPARVSRIASGVPHGGELEYADRVTLGRALDDRREL
ncbi:MAG: recombination mediator RecR [Polyangia bacterium]